MKGSITISIAAGNVSVEYWSVIIILYNIQYNIRFVLMQLVY